MPEGSTKASERDDRGSETLGRDDRGRETLGAVNSPSQVCAREERSQNIEGFLPIRKTWPCCSFNSGGKGSGQGTESFFSHHSENGS